MLRTCARAHSIGGQPLPVFARLHPFSLVLLVQGRLLTRRPPTQLGLDLLHRPAGCRPMYLRSAGCAHDVPLMDLALPIAFADQSLASLVERLRVGQRQLPLSCARHQETEDTEEQNFM